MQQVQTVQLRGASCSNEAVSWSKGGRYALEWVLARLGILSIVRRLPVVDLNVEEAIVSSLNRLDRAADTNFDAIVRDFMHAVCGPNAESGRWQCNRLFEAERYILAEYFL